MAVIRWCFLWKNIIYVQKYICDLFAGYNVHLDCADFHLSLKTHLLFQNYDALIVRSDTKITAEVLAAGSGSVKVVGRAGAGVDNIDIDAATKNNVVVLK